MVKRNEGATLENVASFNNLRKAYYRLVRITIVEKGKDQEENE